MGKKGKHPSKSKSAASNLNKIQIKMLDIHIQCLNLKKKMQNATSSKEKAALLEECKNHRLNLEDFLKNLPYLNSHRSTNIDQALAVSNIEQNYYDAQAMNIRCYYELDQYKTAIDLYEDFKQQESYKFVNESDKHLLSNMAVNIGDSPFDIDFDLQRNALSKCMAFIANMRDSDWTSAYEMYQELINNQLYKHMPSEMQKLFFQLQSPFLFENNFYLGAIVLLQRDPSNEWSMMKPDSALMIAEGLLGYVNSGYDAFELERDESKFTQENVTEDERAIILKYPFGAANLCLDKAHDLIQNMDDNKSYRRWSLSSRLMLLKFNSDCIKASLKSDSEISLKEIDEIYEKFLDELSKMPTMNVENYRLFQSDFHEYLFRISYVYYNFIEKNKNNIKEDQSKKLQLLSSRILEHLAHKENYDSTGHYLQYIKEKNNFSKWIELALKNNKEDPYALYYKNLQKIEEDGIETDCKKKIITEISISSKSGNPYASIALNDYRHRKKDPNKEKLYDDLVNDYPGALENSDNSSLLNTLGERFFYRFGKSDLAKEYWQKSRELGDYKGAIHLAKSAIFEIIPFQYQGEINGYSLNFNFDGEWFDEVKISHYQVQIIRAIQYCSEAISLGGKDNLELSKIILCLFNLASICLQSDEHEELYERARAFLILACENGFYFYDEKISQQDLLLLLEDSFKVYRECKSGLEFAKSQAFKRPFRNQFFVDSNLEKAEEKHNSESVINEDSDVGEQVSSIASLFKTDSIEVNVERLSAIADCVFKSGTHHIDAFKRDEDKIIESIEIITKLIKSNEEVEFSMLIGILSALAKLRLSSTSQILQKCLFEVCDRINRYDTVTIHDSTSRALLVSLSYFYPSEVGIDLLKLALSQIKLNEGQYSFYSLKECYYAIAVIIANCNEDEFGKIQPELQAVIEALNHHTLLVDLNDSNINQKHMHRFILSTDYISCHGFFDLHKLTERDDYKKQFSYMYRNSSSETISNSQSRVIQLLKKAYPGRKIEVESKQGLLPCDCFLPFLGIVVEVNGHQHYRCNNANQDARHLTANDQFKVSYKELKLKQHYQNAIGVLCLDVTICDSLNDQELTKHIQKAITNAIIAHRQKLQNQSINNVGRNTSNSPASSSSSSCPKPLDGLLFFSDDKANLSKPKGTYSQVLQRKPCASQP